MGKNYHRLVSATERDRSGGNHRTVEERWRYAVFVGKEV